MVRSLLLETSSFRRHVGEKRDHEGWVTRQFPHRWPSKRDTVTFGVYVWRGPCLRCNESGSKVFGREKEGDSDAARCDAARPSKPSMFLKSPCNEAGRNTKTREADRLPPPPSSWRIYNAGGGARSRSPRETEQGETLGADGTEDGS